MKILHITPTYLPATRYGGPIYSVHGLCKAQSELHMDVTVVTTSVNGTGDSAVEHGVATEVDGVRVIYFRSRFLRRLYYSGEMARWLKAHLAQFDIVHLHSIFLWPTNFAARLAIKHRKPYLVAPRGMLVPELISAKSSLIKRAWLTLFERSTLRHAARTHLTSQHEQQAALQVIPELVAPTQIPNGFTVPSQALSAPAWPELQDWSNYFLFVGRMHWSKGIDVLLDAIQSVPHAKLVLAGPDDGYLEAIQKKVAALHIGQRVKWVDAVSDARKWGLIRHCLAFVLPSPSENFGMAALEAMALGRPVIVSSGVGLADRVAAQGAGWVFDHGTDTTGEKHRHAGKKAVSQLVSVITSALQNATQVELAANRALRLAADEFTWPSIALLTQRLYQDILATPVTGQSR